MKKMFVSAFLLFLFASAFFGISAITTGEFDERSLRILITTSAASFYSLIGLACVANFRKRADSLGKFGLVFCGLALVHAIYTTWTAGSGSFSFLKDRVAFLIIAMAIAHACLMMLIAPRSKAVSGMIAIAIGAVVLNTLLAVGSVYNGGFGAITMIGVLAIIATCATIAAPVLNYSQSKPE